MKRNLIITISLITILIVGILIFNHNLEKEIAENKNNYSIELTKNNYSLNPTETAQDKDLSNPQYKGQGNLVYESQIVYEIENGKLINSFLLGDNNKKVFKELLENQREHLKTWEFITKLFPLYSYDKLWTQVAFGPSNMGALTAGPINGEDPQEFKMDLASEKFTPHITYYLIHEFGHILTLNANQLDAQTSKEKCETYYIVNGCFKENSYGNKFAEKFWKGSNYEKEYLKLKSTSQDPGSYDYENPAWEKLFKKYENDFVSSYASSSIEEDLAETFTDFIMKEKPTGKSTIKNQKILFFYEFSEMIKLKEDVTNNIKNLEKEYNQKII